MITWSWTSTGKSLNKGKLASGINTINIVNMAAGMYLIRFSDDSQPMD